MTSIQRKPWIVLMLAAFAAHTSIAAEPAESNLPAGVVAKQGDATVTLDDIDAFAARIPAEQRAGFFNSPTRIEGVITNLLLQRQLAADARKAGLDRDPLVVRQLALAEDEALSKVRMQRYREGLKLPDFEELAQEEYVAHKEKYIRRGQLVVKHVLISTKSRGDDEAKKLAETVEKEAQAHPDQFDALVEKYSEDPSKESNRGEMDDAGNASKYVPEFAAAASALKKVGDISPPVKTPFGYHVIKLTERTSDKPRTFAEVKPEIVARLRNDFVEKQVRTYSDTLRNQPVDANPDLVASLRTRYGQVQNAPEAEPETKKAAGKDGK
jgi:peptidyl-prolyl cis-trans isomerase C